MSDEEDVRRFSVAEANGLLGEVIPLLETLRESHRMMESVHDVVMDSVPTNGGGEVHREFLEASSEAARASSLLSDMGVILRDPGTGLIDFPSEREGEVVFLCFQLGETEVGWWHPPETGRAGRRPL